MTTQTPKVIKTTLIFLILLFSSNIVCAHGNLTMRINKKTRQISKDPTNAFLYYERGFLYQQHNQNTKAIKDYKKSELLGNKGKLLYYRTAETYLILGKTKEALLAVDSYFKINSIDIKIHKLKSSILVQDGEFEKALTFHSYFLENTIDLNPEDFLEHSAIILMMNDTNYVEAIATINLGLEKLGGNTITLHLKKLEYLKANGETEKVIKIYDSFILKSERKESWYYKKATFLYTIERFQESNIALQQAKLAIQRLSLKFQNTKAIKELIKKINQLENLQKDE